MTNQELAKLAIKNENTPELGQYWQKRYEKFLKNDVFIISDKTESLLGQTEPVDSPSTPYGYLNMPVFVSKNKIIDEVMLQNCIETSVRFLDSLLDVINFTDQTKILVNQNRKIGLGVVNFDQYLKLREVPSKVEEIDHIGEIISSSSYRASEALAEEKGTCDNWESLAFIIRPKSFEYWYNNETGEVKSGLNIAEDYTSSNLMSSNFEIIPRRNSHILLYPNDLEWQIWSDRDDNSVIASDLSNSQAPLPTTLLEQDDDNDYTPSFEQQTLNSQTEQVDDKSDLNITTPIGDLPLINPISTLQKKISTWFAIDPNIQKFEPENKFDLSKNQAATKIPNDFITSQATKYVEPPEPIIQIKEVEVIREVEVVKEINKPIIVQIVSLSNEAKKILVDKVGSLPSLEYSFESEIEQQVIAKVEHSYGVNINFMEISSIEFFDDKIYVVYQAKIHNLSDTNDILHYDFIEALHKEQDIIAYSKSIDRVHRWQQSARIKAQDLLKQYNQNQQSEANESESKIIAQKNLFIEGLQTTINQLKQDNSQIESQKNQEIDILQNDLKSLKIELSQQKPVLDQKPGIEQEPAVIFDQQMDKREQVVLVKNEDLALDPEPQTIPSQQTIPTININTNPMPQVAQSDQDRSQAAFKTSRDKMFMPTLEIETKLGVPVIVNAKQNDDQDEPTKIIPSSDPKSASHAANVLLKLKRLTR
jgi:Ribonucleotide reductase, barrel domain